MPLIHPLLCAPWCHSTHHAWSLWTIDRLKTMAGLAFCAANAFAPAAAQVAASPDMATASAEYTHCVADHAKTRERFRTLLERKKSEGADTTSLETRMKKILDDTTETCEKIAAADVKIAATDAKIADNKAKIAAADVKIAAADAKIAAADAKIAAADVKIAELDKINKKGAEINLELQALDKTINDYSNDKITAGQFQSRTARVPQFVEEIKIHIAHVKRVIQDPKVLAIYSGYEEKLQPIAQQVALINAANRAKK